MILRHFQNIEDSESKPIQKTLPNENSYDDDSDATDYDDNLDYTFEGSDETCTPGTVEIGADDANNLKIIEADVDDDSDNDVDSHSKFFGPPKNIIINSTILIDTQNVYSPSNLNDDEDNDFFQVDDNEFDGYRELDPYGYKPHGKYLSSCKDVKHCRTACNRVHKALCNQFNCNKLKTTFKKNCKEKCEESFPDSDTDNYDEYGRNGDYYV